MAKKCIHLNVALTSNVGSSRLEIPFAKWRSDAKVSLAAPAPGSALDRLIPGECGMGAVWPRDGVGWEDVPALPHRVPPPHPEGEGAVPGAEPALYVWDCFRPKRRCVGFTIRGDFHSICS